MMTQNTLPGFNASTNNWRYAKQDKRRRIQFRFWLDDNKPAESELGASLEVMKQRRKFSQTIRDALRLFFALLVGDTSVLMELFPAVVEQIQQQAIADMQTQPASELFGAMMQRIAQLEDKVEMSSSEVTQAIRDEMTPVGVTQSPQNGANSSVMKPLGGSAGNGGIKPLAGLKPLAPPAFDSDSDLLEVRQASKPTGSSSAAMNFINAMYSLQETSR